MLVLAIVLVTIASMYQDPYLSNALSETEDLTMNATTAIMVGVFLLVMSVAMWHMYLESRKEGTTTERELAATRRKLMPSKKRARDKYMKSQKQFATYLLFALSWGLMAWRLSDVC